jgi:hypothetical protein
MRKLLFLFACAAIPAFAWMVFAQTDSTIRAENDHIQAVMTMPTPIPPASTLRGVPLEKSHDPNDSDKWRWITGSTTIKEYIQQHGMTAYLQTLDHFVGAIRMAGYRCDSISVVQPYVFGRGYKMTCNRWRYTYDLEDKGGNLTVTVE